MAIKRTKIKILKAGKYVKNGKEFSITKDTLRQFIDNFKDSSVSTKDLPVFVGHSPPGQEPPAVAWIKDLLMSMDVNGGIWLTADVEWTNEDLADDIGKNKSFKYVSIEAALNDKHPNTGEDIGAVLEGLALTNKPFIRELPEIQLSTVSKEKKADCIYLSTQVDLKQDSEKKETPIMTTNLAEEPAMAPQEVPAADVVPAPESAPKSENALLEALRSGMAMPEMTEEEAVAHIAEMCKMMEEAKSELKATEDVPAKTEEAPEAEAVVSEEEKTEDEDEALKAACGPKPEEKLMASKASHDATTAVVLSLTEENKTLKHRLEKFEAKELEDLVVSHIALGRIPAGKKSTYITLAKENRDLFNQLVEGTSTLPTVPNKNTKVSLSKESVVSKKSPDGLKDSELIGDYAKAVLANARKTLKNSK